MKKLLKIAYGATSYLVGLGALTAYVLFLGPWDLLPRHIDDAAAGPAWQAWLINLGLVLAFGVQHSVMARPWFKKIWTRVVPQELERATYVLASGLFMAAFVAFWQPIEGSLWTATSSIGRWVLTFGWAGGFLFAVAATFMLDHFRLFGVKQLYLHLRGGELEEPQLKQVLFYRWVRHPIQTGMLMVLWFTPHMSASHLLMSVTMTAYVFIGLHFEERQLLRTLGPAYEDYCRRVGKVLPIPPLGGVSAPVSEGPRSESLAHR